MHYLKKSALYPALIDTKPSENLGLIVVIPCHDEPDLISSLKSLNDCYSPIAKTEVIVIINAIETAEYQVVDRNLQTYVEAKSFANRYSNEDINFYIFNFKFPEKHAGVGLARKVGMDEAVRRFEAIGKDGIIVCFDADSQCDPNYLVEIEKAFEQNPKAPGASIYFEHPIEGNSFSDDIYNGIIQYELFLRYYCNALRWAGHPHSFQTIGSSMAVKSKVYEAQGGMNRRKAGEDFYFLEKIIPLGNFIEINTTKVIPSPRPSHRVPFGTGMAISNWLESKSYLYYNSLIFSDLKLFFQSIELIYYDRNIAFVFDSLPESFRKFISIEIFKIAIDEIVQNTNSLTAFKNRFFKWFNLFQCLKFVHFCRDNIYSQVPISQSVIYLCDTFNIPIESVENKSLLLKLRAFDRSHFK